MKNVDISTLYNPATEFSTNNPSIAEILTQGGFNIIDVIFFIIALIFFVNLIIVSFGFIFSNASPENITKNNSRLLNSFIGLAVVLSAFVIVKLITTMLNLDPNILPF